MFNTFVMELIIILSNTFQLTQINKLAISTPQYLIAIDRNPIKRWPPSTKCNYNLYIVFLIKFQCQRSAFEPQTNIYTGETEIKPTHIRRATTHKSPTTSSNQFPLAPPTKRNCVRPPLWYGVAAAVKLFGAHPLMILMILRGHILFNHANQSNTTPQLFTDARATYSRRFDMRGAVTRIWEFIRKQWHRGRALNGGGKTMVLCAALSKYPIYIYI